MVWIFSKLFPKRGRYSHLPNPATAIVSLKTRSSSTVGLLLAFLVCWGLSGFIVAETRSFRDPTSIFFGASRGYDPIYSTVRQKQADDYIQAVTEDPQMYVEHAENPSVCVGVVSIARANARYFRTAVGSLLEGLTAEERKQMFLVLFAAHSDQSDHPATSESWYRKVADRVLVYDLSTAELDHVREMEREKNLFREKGLFDHNYLMKACLKAGTSYMALIEDDVLAIDGWFHRMNQAIKEVEQKTEESGKDKSDFFYLRLFYTEEYLGWNSEEWPYYLAWSVAAFLITTGALLMTRQLFPKSRHVLSTRNIMALCCICLPLSILLFFAAGRVTSMPRADGVSVMNQYGCCFQGIVFPRNKAEVLTAYYDEKRVGFKDTTTEEYADDNGETRWALTPSILQHIGRHSSKGDDFEESTHDNMAVSETLWSFPFELYNAGDLRLEHELAVTVPESVQDHQ